MTPKLTSPTSTQVLFYKVDDGSAILDPVGVMAHEKVMAKISTITISDYFAAVIHGALKDIPFSSVEFIPMSLAKARFLIAEDERDKTCAFVSLDTFSTSISVVCGDGLLGLKTLDVGLMHVVNDICVVEKVDYIVSNALLGMATLSVIKHDVETYSVDGKNHIAALVDDIIKARLEEIADRIKELLPDNMPVFVAGVLCDKICGGRVHMSKYMGIHLVKIDSPLCSAVEGDMGALVSLAVK